MNKKGIYFTTIAIILVSIVILSYVVYNTNRTRDVIDVNTIRIETMNSFYKSLQDKEFKKILDSSTSKAIIALEKYIEDKNSYIPGTTEQDAKNEIIDAIYGADYNKDGKYNYDGYVIKGENIDYTITGLLNTLKGVAQDSGMDFSYTLKKLSIEFIENDPFMINSTMVLDFELTDYSKTINFSRHDITVDDTLSLKSFRDPLFLKKDLTKYIYKPQDVSALANKELWYYTQNDNAPNYFQRLIGNFNANKTYGIQSVIDPLSLNMEELTLSKSNSYVDRIYFSGAAGTEVKCVITIDESKEIALDKDSRTFYDRYLVKEGADYKICTNKCTCEWVDGGCGGGPCTDNEMRQYKICGARCDVYYSKCVLDTRCPGACVSDCDNDILECGEQCTERDGYSAACKVSPNSNLGGGRCTNCRCSFGVIV